MDNKFDKKITRMLNEDIYIPQKITNRIKTSLEEERKGVWLSMKLSKVVTIIAAVVIIGTGAVFATKAFIENRKATDIAREHGYFEDGQKEYIFFDGLGMRVDNYFMDKNQLGITFGFETKRSIGFNPISVQTSEICFYDENGEEITLKNITTGDNMGFEGITNIDNSHATAMYTMWKAKGFTAQKIIVKIDKVLFVGEGGTHSKEYRGNWEFELDTQKYLNNQNDVQYKGTTDAENIIVQKAELTATNFNIVLKVDNLNELVKPYISPFDIEKLIGTDVEIDISNISWSMGCDYENNIVTINIPLSKFEAHDEYQLMLIVNEGSDPKVIVTLTRE